MFTLLSQNRALYCYILLTLWIFLMIAGMYRYVGTEENISSGIRQVPDIPTKTFSKDLKPNIKTKRVLRQCNLPEYMEADEEGRVEGSYSLESLTILLRHGDRGPMNHVRNISSIDCSSSDPLYSSYNSFWANISLRQSANPFLPFLSTFHNYPLVPPVRGGCELGQLTPLGASQLLHVGALLRSVYGTQLGLDNFTLGAQDIQLYSTPYRRTFQSLLAFLHEFLHPDELQKFTIKEVSSLAFCFHECACSAAYYYTKLFDAQKLKYLQSHPAVIKLVRKASQIVYELNSKHLSSDPHALRDALLSYVCHGASLPCHQSDCVKSEDVTGVFAYIEWETRQYSRMVNMRRSHLLKAYGLLKRLVSSLLSSVSDNKPRLSVYSGHDYTLRYLAVTLGLYTDATASPIYASRFIIELYKNKAPSTLYEDNASSSRQYYLRFLFNGKDLTNKISFCKRAGFRHSDTAFLCPIESVVRFLHDDYFTTFNTTNFKDACMRS
ncbi:hypothetical protein M8J77_020774 [Diaphorina citri]|nr:hypothetical protein M8J77_020774 [Diaphorina citri]